MRKTPFIIIWLLLSLSNVLAEGNRWPGWRGDGNGLSEARNLPVEWSPDHNILWKTRIGGDGISSPIVWDDRVFVSTAIESPDRILSKKQLIWFSSGILILFLLSTGYLIVSGMAKRDRSGPQWWFAVALWMDRLLVTGATLLFVYMLLELLFQTEPFREGDPGGTWMASSRTLMLGLIAAVGFLPVRSKWRLLGLPLLGGLSLAFYLWLPLREATLPFGIRRLLKVVGPMTVAGVWYLFAYLLSRFADDSLAPNRWVSRAACALSLFLLVALNFTFFNVWVPQRSRNVVALDRATGEVLWERAGFRAPSGRKYRTNSYATPTPVTDGRFLVANFGPGMVCLDFEGNIQWTRMEPLYREYLRYGASSSPVIVGDRLILPFFAENPDAGAGDHTYPFQIHSYLAALDLATGKELWRADSIPGAHESYGTPLVLKGQEETLVLITTYHHGLAFDVDTGERRWLFQAPLEQPVPSPVSDQESAYLAGGTHGPASVTAVRLGGQGDITETHQKWQVTKGIPDVSSPVVLGDQIYWVTLNGIFYCADKESGEILYRKRLTGGRFTGALAAGDGKIYIPSSDGTTSVVAAGSEYRLLSKNSIDEDTLASPALVEGQIFIRGLEHLYSIANPRPVRSPPGSAGEAARV